MRRLLPVVIATLLAVLLLVPAAATAASASAPSDGDAVVVLAAEGGGEGAEGGAEPAGPEPDLQNTNAPADYEPPFLINAAVGLTALLLLVVLGVGSLYWLLVQRPRQQAGA
jgi:hypothetical protein